MSCEQVITNHAIFSKKFFGLIVNIIEGILKTGQQTLVLTKYKLLTLNTELKGYRRLYAPVRA